MQGWRQEGQRLRAIPHCVLPSLGAWSVAMGHAEDVLSPVPSTTLFLSSIP